MSRACAYSASVVSMLLLSLVARAQEIPPPPGSQPAPQQADAPQADAPPQPDAPPQSDAPDTQDGPDSLADPPISGVTPRAAPAPPIQVVEAEQAPAHAPPVAPPPPPPARTPRLRRADYTEGMPLPPGVTLRERPRIGLAIAGGALFTFPYIVSAIVASDDDVPDLYIPFVGPFIRAGRDVTYPIVRIPLVLLGLAQIGGVAMFVAGIMTKQRWVEYYATSEDGRRSVALRPSVGASNGLALQVDFVGM